MSQQANISIGKHKPKQKQPKNEKNQLIRTRNAEQTSQLDEKQRLIDQNIKLKTQIYDLSKQLDQIMGKQQQRKKKFEFKQGEKEQVTKSKKIQLKKQQLEVMSLKNKIHNIKRHLQSVYNNRSLMAKQDQLKYLKTQLENLQQQKKGLLKIRHEQSKILKNYKNEEEYEQKIEQLKKQVNSLKQQSKSLNDKLMQSEKILRKNHEQYIVKQNKVRQLQQKLLNAQTKAKKRKPIQSVTPEMLENLEQEISSLEQDRRQAQKQWHDKITLIDTELREKKIEQQKKLMTLKQKQKQLKLNELKIRQLRKLIKYNMTEGNERVTEELQQFKYRRNIRQLKQ